MWQEQKAFDEVKVRVRVSDVSDTYRIMSVSPEDSGTYYCRASNSLGIREVAADVTLMGEHIY